VVSASRTLTVRNGQTASVQVGWVVVGAGIGGFVAVGGSTLPVEGDTAVIIEENNSGQDELSTIALGHFYHSNDKLRIQIDIKLDIFKLNVKLNSKPNTIQYLPET